VRVRNEVGVGEGPTQAPLDFSGLFEPITINGLTLRNRFVMPGMQRRWCEDGKPAAFLGAYYRRRIEGGAALVITEACAVDHPSATQVAHYGWITERTKDAWRSCVATVNDAGGSILIQLWHEGAIRPEGGDGPLAAHPSLSPSGLAHATRPNGRAATREDMDDIRDAFVRGAVIAREIGAGGVEVHACHGYLLDQFLWPETNRRADGYGGADIRDRARFPAEIVAAIRAATGHDYPISLRFSQWKEVDYGARIVENPAELEIMLGVFEDAGVDVFHVSARRFWVPEWPGSDLGLAGWTKKLTDRPVIGVGSVGLDVDVMDNLLGKAEAKFTGRAGLRELAHRFNRRDFDLISVGRGQLGDPDWVEKLHAGRIDEIRHFDRDDLRPGGGEVPELIAEAHR
jgi:2,4-dienoyl-CoA reductase-like NADH-dependent reductase (Old Yellow Enzyme family)